MPKSNPVRSFLLNAIILLIVMVAPMTLTAQGVGIEIDFDSYDVVYLADFINPTTGKLSGTIPNVSFVLTSRTPTGSVRLYLEINAQIRFRGDASAAPLFSVPARTSEFELRGTRVITSRELSEGALDIRVVEYKENESVKNRLEEHAKRFPTAPVGTYDVSVQAFAAGTGALLGSSLKTVSIQNAAVSEVQVTLIDPLPGETVSTPFPTFSWSSDRPEVTLYVYEKLPIHRSPEEAITGIPYLVMKLENRTTFTYPTTAPRRLEQNKSYFWFVETSVQTNRGVEKRQSEIRMFRVNLEQALAQAIEQIMNSLGGDFAGTMATLQQMGWVPTSNPTLDGRTMTREELIALINQLISKNTKLNVRVESQ